MPGSVRSFNVEWFDANAAEIKKFVLNYHPTGEIDMIDLKYNRVFLKKQFVQDVEEADLYIGSTVTVFSRQLQIVGYTNTATANEMDKKRRRVFSLIQSQGVSSIGPILSAAASSGFVVNQLKMVKLTTSDVERIPEFADELTSPSAMKAYTSGPVIAMELVANGGDSSSWRQTLEGVIGEAAYVSVDGESTAQATFFFNDGNRLASPHVPGDDCTLCLIKPHVIRCGKAGNMISDITNAGYEIAAMEMFHLDRATANEFLDVYKGVITSYNETLAALTSAPTIALQIVGGNGDPDQIVTDFREFTAGPYDPEIARTLRPDSLRAKYGISQVDNAVHCTDLPQDGGLESTYFFETLQV